MRARRPPSSSDREADIYRGIALTLGLVGLLLVAFGLMSAVPQLAFRAAAARGDGLVVSIVPDQSCTMTRGGDHYCHEVWKRRVRFAVGGTTYVFTDGHGDDTPRDHHAGERVTVGYDRAAPDDARILRSAFSTYVGAALLGLLGLMFAALAARMAIESRRVRSHT